MSEPTYKIRRILKKTATGITKASYCTLDAILKFDSEESPHCVYNELVATRLAQTLHIPLADGVLTSTGDGPAYASLEVGSPGLSLPDMLDSQKTKVALAYPDEVAALVAFDILIGNRDRARNIKASLVTPHIPIFRAFDHSHALLTIENDPFDSIDRLRKGEPIVRYHPFFGLVSGPLLKKWADRIKGIPHVAVEECAYLGKPFRGVGETVQRSLVHALTQRVMTLPKIIDSHLGTIKAQP